MARILILGGNGFIGSRLCLALRAHGAEVVSFDLRAPAHPVDGVRYLEGDFFRDEDLFAAVEQADAAVHAVSLVNPTNSRETYLAGYTREFAQAAKLCDAVRRAGKRLLFLSSGGTVYGNGHHQRMPEDTVMRPISHYGSLKLCIETMIQTFARDGADFWIARVGNAYGPGQDYRKGVGFIDAAIKRALARQPIEIWGDGSVERDYIHVDDICEMLCELLAARADERVFNVGTGVGTSQRQILGFLRNEIGDLEVAYLPARSVDVRSIILDTSRYEAAFRYRPRSVEQGVRDYLRYLRQAGAPEA